MDNKLIFAMALLLVLVSGGLFSAQADFGLNPCGWNCPSVCDSHYVSHDNDYRDFDKPGYPYGSCQEKMDRERAAHYDTYYD